MKIVITLFEKKALNCRLFCCIFAFLNFCSFHLKAQHASLTVDSTINVIDGSTGQYADLHGGDTIFLKAGSRNKLLIRNFSGYTDTPIIFLNKNGIVFISTNDYYGISVINCRYIRISGRSDSSNFYGIQINKVATGCGIGIGAMSTDVEVDHVLIENCSTAGIYAKTDPDCSVFTTREKFTQYNTFLHDNYISKTGTEGMYIGSSSYAGVTLNCAGKDTFVLPPVLNGVKIYNNIVTNTGWDGIQVSSAALHCQVYNNTVLNDSQAEVPNQMSGILLGGGSKCNCNNNLVKDGKGDGIENHGLGGNSIFNNIIVNAGRGYLTGNPLQMKHGIFVSDVSMMKDSSVTIAFNDIINPKSDGIRFQSIKSRDNIIASNLIVNPGNYYFYPAINTSFKATDAYVMLPSAAADVQVKNNFFTLSLQQAGVNANDYSIMPGSPLINTGCSIFDLSFDFNYKRRRVGGLFDIGALEFCDGADTLQHTFKEAPQLYPNPVKDNLQVKYLSLEQGNVTLGIYNMAGKLLQQQTYTVTVPGIQQLDANVKLLPQGCYFLTLQQDKKNYTSKFIKL